MADIKNIVKEIFERQKQASGKISAIFTHFRQPSKAVILPKISPRVPVKSLPAAIDLGTFSLKLFQAGQGQSGELEIINLDREIYSGDKKEALKKILARNQIGSTILATISAKDVQIYNLTFPRMSEPELNQAMQWKIAQLRPLNLGLEEIAYGCLKGREEGGLKSTQQKVLLVCAPKSLVNNSIALFQEAGLKVADIQVGPLSLAYLDSFQKLKEPESRVTIWLDLGHEESTLVITKRGEFYFCRSLSFTAQSLTKHLAQHLRLDESQAEELKQQYGLSAWPKDDQVAVFSQKLGGDVFSKPKDKAQEVYYGLISSLENLVVDIEHSFKYFSYQVTQSQITKFDRLILCGGGCLLKNLAEFLKAKLGVPVESLNPFSLFKFSAGPEAKKKVFLSFPEEFAVSAAAAVSPKIEAAKFLSLMPKSDKKGLAHFREHLKEKPVKIVAAVLALAVFLIIWQIARIPFYAWKMNALGRSVQAAQTSLSALQSNQLKLAKQEAELLEQKARFESRLRLIDEAVRRPENFSQTLAKAGSLLPEEIWITRLAYIDKKLNITGSAPNMNLVMELLEALKASKEFSSATFNYTQKEPEREVYNFEIVAELNR